MTIQTGNTYILNSTTKIKVVGDTDNHYIVEIGDVPRLTAQILKQDLIDGLDFGYISTENH